MGILSIVFILYMNCFKIVMSCKVSKVFDLLFVSF